VIVVHLRTVDGSGRKWGTVALINTVCHPGIGVGRLTFAAEW
jgi:hypothetical protein